MRERADLPSDVTGPWHARDKSVVQPIDQSADVVVARQGFPDGWADETYQATAAHIASWHPAVALAVADWLDSVAGALMPPHHTPHPDCGRSISPADEQAAIAVARAYLNEEPA